MKMPKKLGFFDYEIPEDMKENLTIGSFVKIPFRNKFISGVVNNIKNSTEQTIVKKIEKYEEFWGKVNPKQLEIIRWFSRYYAYPISSTLTLFYPESTKKNAKFSFDWPNEIVNQKKHPPMKKFIDDLLSATCENFFLFPREKKLKEVFYHNLLNEIKGQTLILFPYVESAFEFASGLPQNWRKVSAILTNYEKQSKNKRNHLLKRIKNNEVKLIIGTRSAVFAPFFDLKMIIVDCAHSDDYKQVDREPRYDVAIMAKKLAEVYKTKTIFSTLSPKVIFFNDYQNNNAKVITLGKNTAEIEIIDFEHERKKGFGYLTDRFLNKLSESVLEKKKILLIVNKSGEAGQLLCHDCGYGEMCSDCQLPMTVFSNKLLCTRCGQEKNLLLRCPICQSFDLRKKGAGAIGIKKQIESLTGLKIEMLSSGEKPKNDLTMIDYLPVSLTGWPKFDLIGIVYLDNLLHLSDFAINEKLYCLLNNLLAENSTEKKWQLLIQTNFAQNEVFKNLGGDYFKFYKVERNFRREYGYPPEKALLKIYFEHHDESVAQKEASQMAEALIKDLPKTARMEGPYLYYRRKIRQRFRFQIALFFNNENELQEFLDLDKIPKFWRIDRNPISLL